MTCSVLGQAARTYGREKVVVFVREDRVKNGYRRTVLGHMDRCVLASEYIHGRCTHKS